jgi:hypothetical protein
MLNQNKYRVLLIVSLLFSTAPALAKEKPDRKPPEAQPTEREPKERAERAARKACLEGDFVKGVSILSDLYLDFKDPTYIFNQGRCFQQSEKFRDAIKSFREYIRVGGEDVEVVQKHIAECEEMEAKRKVAEMEVNPNLAVALPPPRNQTLSSLETEVAAPSPRQENQGSGMRISGVVVGSIGVAALATGLILNLQANKLANDNATSVTPTVSRRDSKMWSSIIAYGVGGGALVTGVLLYLIGRPSSDASPPQVSFFPVVMPKQFSLTITRIF